ncbi:hypothetical protein ACLKA7_001377 [Drosophila subpalustris]
MKNKISETRSAIAPPEAVLSDDGKQQLDSDDDDDVWKDFDTAFQQVSKPINITVATIREMDKYLAEKTIRWYGGISGNPNTRIFIPGMPSTYAHSTHLFLSYT